MKQPFATFALTLATLALLSACGGRHGEGLPEAVPEAPDYNDSIAWYTELNDSTGQGADVFYVVATWEFDYLNADSVVCHYADTYNAIHRHHMNMEQRKVAEYMAPGNNFYAPYYRHITLESWATLNEDTIERRLQVAMGDVKRAFDHFVSRRDPSRPLVLAGFSQGGRAVVELLKHMDDETYSHIVAAYVLGYKVTPDDTTATTHIRAAQDSSDIGVTICYNTVKDVKYTIPLVSDNCALCINPVNWRTDSTPATLHDTITVACSPMHHVLVVTGYEASEYPPLLGFINVGDIHCCEPWLYSECLRRNIALRIRMWRQQHDSH